MYSDIASLLLFIISASSADVAFHTRLPIGNYRFQGDLLAFSTKHFTATLSLTTKARFTPSVNTGREQG